MAETKQTKALFKAAKSGDVEVLKKLLAEGAPLEATDLNKMTPVMLAAQAGQAEAFGTLVEHGANLHALALCQIDLLECAAEGGNVEIIRFLIDKGMPLEGHWKPRSKAEGKMGHLTPLQTAALNSHVEAVRLLLEAGADRKAKFDGQTALQRAEDDIKFPVGEDQARLKPQYEAIVALLKAKGPSR
jgi:uncharacterized protein